MVSPHDEPLELVDSRYPEWRSLFERERVATTLVDRGLDDLHRLEHVGSTAVPGLAAKNVVDLDVVVADDAVAAVSTALTTTLGGTRHENSIPWQPVFRSTEKQRFNDHVFAVSDDGWRVSVATAACGNDRRYARSTSNASGRPQTPQTTSARTVAPSPSSWSDSSGRPVTSTGRSGSRSPSDRPRTRRDSSSGLPERPVYCLRVLSISPETAASSSALTVWPIPS